MRLKQLAPTWSKAFDQWDRLNAHEREAIKFDLKMHTRCVVAEAHGWKDVYARGQPSFCSECDYYAFSFAYVINGPLNMLDKQLLGIKDREFSRHWFRCHTSKKDVKKKKTKPRR